MVSSLLCSEQAWDSKPSVQSSQKGIADSDLRKIAQILEMKKDATAPKATMPHS